MNTQITVYIAVEQKHWLDSRPKGSQSVSSLFRDFLDTLMENDPNEPTSTL